MKLLQRTSECLNEFLQLIEFWPLNIRVTLEYIIAQYPFSDDFSLCTIHRQTQTQTRTWTQTHRHTHRNPVFLYCIFSMSFPPQPILIKLQLIKLRLIRLYYVQRSLRNSNLKVPWVPRGLLYSHLMSHK